MSTLATLTPFETIKFSQAIADRSTDELNFERISASLRSNELIRSREGFTETQLSASALQKLYHALVEDENRYEPHVNGDGGDGNAITKKRKLSDSLEQEAGEEQQALTAADRIYAKFREETINQIQKDEQEYARLQNEIKELEKQVGKPLKEQNKASPAPTQPPPHKRQPSRTDVSALLNDEQAVKEQPPSDEGRREQSGSLPPQPEARPPSTAQIPPALPLPSQASPVSNHASGSAPPTDLAHPPPHQQVGQQHHSPGAFHRTLPPPSPSRPGFPPPHGYVPGPQGIAPLAPSPSMQQMPPPMEYAGQRKASSASNSARGSPVPGHLPQQQPPQQSPYPPYSPYQQMPPQHWQQPYPPQHGYPAPVPYPNQHPYYSQSPGGRPHPGYQTPHQPPYQHYPQTAPLPYPSQLPHGWHPSYAPGPYTQPASAATTPVPQAQRPPVLRSSGSSTPWKRRQLPPGTPRPSSPTRPEREVSPLTDAEGDEGTSQPPSAQITRKQSKASDETTPKQEPRSRRDRPPNITPSGSAAMAASRSQSVASHKSETPTEPRKLSTRRTQPQMIKTEIPSTPAPVSMPPSEEATPVQRSSGRRGRPRTNTVTSSAANRAEPSRPTTTTSTAGNKRKYASLTPPLHSPGPQQAPTASRQALIHHHHPSLVLVSRNFAKTSQIVLNEITSHKLAGIFAKPLTEREAPGYKDLIKRPMDLKTLKAAITRGSKAAVAAIEAFETHNAETTEAGSTHHSDSEPKEKDLENGLFLVHKSEDLMPPKGVVNSSQLEMELTRMFANAVMFNPLDKDERGFGRDLKLRREGGSMRLRSGRKLGRFQDGEEEDEEGTAEKEEAESANGESKLTTPEDTAASPSASAETESTDADEAAIIKDTREMFEDVLGLVRKWRDLENERLGLAGGGASGEHARNASLSAPTGRQGSVSSAIEEAATPNAGAEEGEGGGGIGRGSMRKRRKVNDG